MSKLFSFPKLTFCSLLMGFLLIFLYYTHLVKLSGKINTTDDEKPDSYLLNSEILILDLSGQPKLKIKSPEITHYKNGAHIILPYIKFFQENLPAWEISSSYARSYSNLEKIIFYNNVLVKREPSKNLANTTIKTTELTLFPDQKKVITQQRIVFFQPDVLVKAIGMKANMKTGEIQLLSKGQGEYASSN